MSFIQEVDKGSAVVVWDREDYLKEEKKQPDDKNVCKELAGDVEGPIEKIIKIVLKKVRDRRDIRDNTIRYFLVNNLKLGRFYLLPKIHKRLQNLPGRFVISNKDIIRKTFQPSLSFSLKYWHRKLNLI